jgi:hypothetical protein
VDAWEPTLRREFEAADGSFLIQLRCGMVWDREAFLRLVAAMELCAAEHAGRESLERWVAEGFWYVGWFVPEWSGHPNFPRPEAAYHRRACDRLHDLAWWFFTGHHPLESGGPFEPL